MKSNKTSGAKQQHSFVNESTTKSGKTASSAKKKSKYINERGGTSVIAINETDLETDERRAEGTSVSKTIS